MTKVRIDITIARFAFQYLMGTIEACKDGCDAEPSVSTIRIIVLIFVFSFALVINASAGMARLPFEIADDQEKIREKYTDFENNEIELIYENASDFITIYWIESKILCRGGMCPAIIINRFSGEDSILRVFTTRDARAFTSFDMNERFPGAIVFYHNRRALGYAVFNEKTVYWAPSLLSIEDAGGGRLDGR